MNNITPYPVLAHIVGIIKNAVSDLKIEYISTGIANLKDGNDSIYLEQQFDNTGTFATIFIKDPREIIFSEDLLPILKDLNQDVKENIGLQTTTIVINDLNIETNLILETAKDVFDEISSSYEFVKTTEKEPAKVKSAFKFGNHRFEATIINESDQIYVTSEFSSTIDQTIKKNIEADTLKVQKALCTAFKKDKI